jgi:predicted DNA-binding transcriptional regulator AlpA
MDTDESSKKSPVSSAPSLSEGGNLRRLVLAPTARGLHRVEAARYVGVSPTKFDELVKVGQMPGPKRIGTRRVWDVRALDLAFDALPGDTPEESNPWDN